VEGKNWPSKFWRKERLSAGPCLKGGTKRGELCSPVRGWDSRRGGGEWFCGPGAYVEGGEGEVLILGAGKKPVLIKLKGVRADAGLGD